MYDSTVHEGRDPLETSGSNILVVTSGTLHEMGHSCFQHVNLPRSDETAALFITTTRSQAACLEAWQATVGDLPSKLAFVGEDNQGQATTGEQGHRDSAMTIRDVRDAGDLIEVGIAVSELLEDWETGDYHVVVWFESLTEPLHRSGVSHVYRFLAELTSQLNEMDAIGCFQLDADSSNETEIELLEPLFADVVRQNAPATDISEKKPQTATSQERQPTDTTQTTDMGFIYPEDQSSDRNPQARSDEQTSNEGDSDR